MSSLSLRGWQSTAGLQSRNAKLARERVLFIRRTSLPDSVIAKRLGVSVHTVWACRIGKTYREVK